MKTFHEKHLIGAAALALLAGLPAVRAADSDSPSDPIETAERAEAARIALIERISPAVVAILDEGERGGGSGVIIDPAGYGLTNYHVVAGLMEGRRGLGGLADGKLYPLQVLGIDPGGDVAMFRLSGRDAFPYVALGDSDTVRVGDTVVALGNPFMLAEDFTPTVSLGIVSGVNRYQWGAGAGDALLYSDCIQVDAAINPGNSGGPLFNLAGEVIGINGRISVSLRGRVNVGLGYAITANQIRAFLPGLRAGLLVEHGTLQAVVRDQPDGRVVFVELMENGPAWNCGIRPGDALLDFDGRPVRSANEFASILGTLPADWPVPLSFRGGDGQLRHYVVRTEKIPLPQAERYVPDAALNLDAVERVLTLCRQWLARTGADLADRSGWEIPDGAPHATVEQVMTLVTQLGDARFDRSRMADMRHAGADRIATWDADVPATSPPLECLIAPLDETTEARLLIDGETGALRRVVAFDRVTREELICTPRETRDHAAPAMRPWAATLLPEELNAISRRTVKLVGARVGRSAGYGCGILVSSNGLVLTVDSALLDGRHVRAYLSDGTARRVEPVFADHQRQLALSRLSPEQGDGEERYAWYDLDDAAAPGRGAWVIAGGNPFKVADGAEPISFARGVIGGVTRIDATRGTQDFPYRGEVVLIDAITSTPGFAGGPLVAADGRLVGMVGRMVESRTTHTMMNYAIPAAVLADFVAAAFDPPRRIAETRDAGDVPAYHGMRFFELGYRSNPVYVERVRRQSPAARAGVRTDDLVIGANGQPVPNLETLERILAGLHPGDTLELTVMRDDAVHKLSILLEEAPK